MSKLDSAQTLIQCVHVIDTIIENKKEKLLCRQQLGLFKDMNQ